MPTSALDDISKSLIAKAEKALVNAYAPYSRFHVGAALLLEDGTCVTGTNQENASYPLCMCAERVALYAKAALHPHVPIQRIAVVAKRNGTDDLVPATPCGACRQVLVEFETRQNKPIQIIMFDAKESWLTIPSAAELLPHTFTKSNLSA